MRRHDHLTALTALTASQCERLTPASCVAELRAAVARKGGGGLKSLPPQGRDRPGWSVRTEINPKSKSWTPSP